MRCRCCARYRASRLCLYHCNGLTPGGIESALRSLPHLTELAVGPIATDGALRVAAECLPALRRLCPIESSISTLDGVRLPPQLTDLDLMDALSRPSAADIRSLAASRQLTHLSLAFVTLVPEGLFELAHGSA